MLDNAAVRLVGIHKRYTGVTALRDINLELRAGVVTAIVGENGAGKSTLVKLLSGAEPADEGEIWVGGQPLPPDPRGAIKAGVSVVYQELADIADMNVVDNVLLGEESGRSGRTRKRRAARAASALQRVGLPHLDVERPVHSLSIVERQLLNIARSIARDAKVMIFDEATSSLGERDVSRLLSIIQGLKEHNLAIVYVSHRLSEVFDIADHVVVMRDGTKVQEAPIGEWTPRELVRAMLARDLERAYPWTSAEPGPLVLETSQLEAPGVNGASLRSHTGEIVGLIGLAGAGRTELMKTIAGAVKATSGRILVNGVVVKPGSIDAARRAGIVYAPEDRKAEALVLSASVRENVLLGLSKLVSWLGFTRFRAAEAMTRKLLRDYKVRTHSTQQPVSTLSGGNQQKVILARIALTGARVVLLDDPTRGVDVGGKFAIYEEVIALRGAGASILLTSSESDEVLSMADRVYVLRRGQVVGEFDRSSYDREAILALATLESADHGIEEP